MPFHQRLDFLDAFLSEMLQERRAQFATRSHPLVFGIHTQD